MSFAPLNDRLEAYLTERFHLPFAFGDEHHQYRLFVAEVTDVVV